MPSITTSEKKHLGTNLTKESQDLYPQIALPREIKTTYINQTYVMFMYWKTTV